MVSASHSHLLAASIALLAAPINAFTYSRLVQKAGPLYAVDDGSAQALSDYMAKSHEDKLKAIKAVEDSKNLEIEALKAEIRQLKSAGAPSVARDAVSSSDLEPKLASYQTFMTEYVVNAQNQKLLAVKEAELKAEKEFQERLDKLLKASGVELPLAEAWAKKDGFGAGHAATSPVAREKKPTLVEENPVVVEEKPVATNQAGNDVISSDLAATVSTVSSPSLRDLANSAGSSPFQSRNAYIIQAAAVGNSRWVAKEIQKAKEDVQRATPPIASSSYQQRNGQVVAAAAAGKSRWGNMEVERLKNTGMVRNAAPVEKGERIGLDDRVNLGARLLESAQKFMNGGQ